jgi:hypothetical protein
MKRNKKAKGDIIECGEVVMVVAGKFNVPVVESPTKSEGRGFMKALRRDLKTSPC